ncbi:MAG: hypothetical protein QW197_01590 [Candidatus Aenigmatarchaeota archaeon]
MSYLNEEAFINYCYKNILPSIKFCENFLEESKRLLDEVNGVSIKHKIDQICVGSYLVGEISKYKNSQTTIKFEAPTRIDNGSSEIVWSSDIFICYKKEKTECLAIEVLRSGVYQINKKINILEQLLKGGIKVGMFVENGKYIRYNSNSHKTYSSDKMDILSIFGFYKYKSDSESKEIPEICRDLEIHLIKNELF